MSRDFVDSISKGDNIGAETAFNVAMAAKVGDALEIKRKRSMQRLLLIQVMETNETD